MLNLTTQELYFLKSAVESATIKGTDVRFVAQVLTKIDKEFELAVQSDQENTPPDIVQNVLEQKSDSIETKSTKKYKKDKDNAAVPV